MSRRESRHPAWAAVVAFLVPLASGPMLAMAPAPAAPQEYAVLGRAACVDCHEPDGRHEVEYEWLRERDGSSPGTQHINSFNQLYNEEVESRRFVQALLPEIGNDWEEAMLYDASIGCMRCHATVVGGEPIDGVACEGCHGPGSGYNEIHKERGNYQRAVSEGGMRDVVGKPENWSQICMGCHAMDNATLIAAGHPSGDEFDLGVKFEPVSLHFLQSRNAYAAAQISSLGRQWLAAARSRRDPAVTAPGSDPPAGPGPVTPAAQPEPAPTQPEPAPAQPQTAAGRGAGATDTAPSGAQQQPPPATAAAAADAGAAAAITPARLPPSTVVAPRPPVVDPLLGNALDSVDAGVPAALPRSPAGVVAAVQGRVITLLTELLSRGASSPVRITPPSPAPAYSGPDAELVRLQQEAIALALEALRMAPARQQ